MRSVFSYFQYYRNDVARQDWLVGRFGYQVRRPDRPVLAEDRRSKIDPELTLANVRYQAADLSRLAECVPLRSKRRNMFAALRWRQPLRVIANVWRVVPARAATYDDIPQSLGLATWYATHMRRLTLTSKLIGSCVIALLPSLALAEPSGGIYVLVLVWPIIAALIVTIVAWRVLDVLGPSTARNFSRMLLLAFLWTPVPSLQYPEEMLPVWPSVMYLGFSGTHLLTMTISVSVVAVLGSIVLVTRTLRQLTCRSTSG